MDRDNVIQYLATMTDEEFHQTAAQARTIAAIGHHRRTARRRARTRRPSRIHRTQTREALVPASPEQHGRTHPMTNTTTDKVSPQDALAAAENVYKSTQAAADAALAAASRQALDDAEAAAVQAIADAVTGEGDRATADAARARVEKLRRDHEWAQVELQAAETAMSRAYDDMVRARRGVVAEEIVAAHKVHNDPRTTGEPVARAASRSVGGTHPVDRCPR